MFRVTENAVFESYGYSFGYFWYCKFDESFLNSVPLKIRFPIERRFPRGQLLLFAVGEKLFSSLMRIPSSIFRH